MQWKQGVVVYIVLYIVLSNNTTPIHCTPLRLHPPSAECPQLRSGEPVIRRPPPLSRALALVLLELLLLLLLLLFVLVLVLVILLVWILLVLVLRSALRGLELTNN